MNSRGLALGACLFSVSTLVGWAADPCTDLNELVIPPSSIGLPSGEARVRSAIVVDTSRAVPQGYCRVVGAITPLDPSAPEIVFQVNLPNAWNGKALQYGGGGFNGTLVTGENRLRDAPPTVPTPLAQGYFTFGTDSGHQAARLTEIQAFALNDESLTNFAYASYKKTRDVALVIAAARYASAPSKVYYFGGSEGGREGLMMAQRFPTDYDGVVSVVPVINWVALQSAGNRSGILQQNGGWLNANQVTLLRREVLRACDALDGLGDGVVSDHEGCDRAFRIDNLQCSDGGDSSDSCLSTSQVAAMKALRAPFHLGITLANGVSSYPAWGYGGEDQPGGMLQWVTGTALATFPAPAGGGQGQLWYYGNGAIRYFIARDSAFDPLTYTPERFASRLQRVSELMDATDPNLSAFVNNGGKLILKENMADYAQSPYAGISYYKAVVQRMGQATVDQFLRLYVTPGANHAGSGINGLDGAAIPQYVDLLRLLDDWAAEGKAPPDAPTQIQTAHAAAGPFAVVPSRPMCQYPTFPRYRSGDPSLASSFECVGH